MIAADVYEPGGTGLSGSFSACFGSSIERRAAAPCVAARFRPIRRSMPASGKIVASETRMPLPIAVPRCSWKRSIAARMSSRFCVGGCTTSAVPANETTPTRVLRGCSSTNVLRRGLRGGQPVGLDVGRAHAARHVHREDDRLVLRRQRDHRRRPRDRDDHRDEREQEQQRRDVAAEALARAQRVLHHREARVAHRELLLAAQQQTYAATSSGTSEQQPEQFRPEERHALGLQVLRQRRRRRRAGCGACAGRRSA